MEQEEICSGFEQGFDRGRQWKTSKQGGRCHGWHKIYLHLLPTSCKSASLVHCPSDWSHAPRTPPPKTLHLFDSYTGLPTCEESHAFSPSFFVNCFSWESDRKLGGEICIVWESLLVFVIRNLGVYSEGWWAKNVLTPCDKLID